MKKRLKLFLAAIMAISMAIAPVSGVAMATEYVGDVNIEEYTVSPRAVVPYCFCTGAPARMQFKWGGVGYCPSCGTSSNPLGTTAYIYECTVCHSQQAIDEFGHSLIGAMRMIITDGQAEGVE